MPPALGLLGRPLPAPAACEQVHTPPPAFFPGGVGVISRWTLLRGHWGQVPHGFWWTTTYMPPGVSPQLQRETTEEGWLQAWPGPEGQSPSPGHAELSPGPVPRASWRLLLAMGPAAGLPPQGTCSLGLLHLGRERCSWYRSEEARERNPQAHVAAGQA